MNCYVFAQSDRPMMRKYHKSRRTSRPVCGPRWVGRKRRRKRCTPSDLPVDSSPSDSPDRSKMRDKPWWMCFLVICAFGIAKAHLHMIRLVILLALGLAGMYMLHMLAQDFTKIRNSLRPRGGGLGIFKRSITEDWVSQRLAKDTEQMGQVLKNDPIGCARKYVCHISLKSRAKLTKTQDNVLTLLRTFRWLDTSGEWQKAEETGKRSGREGDCEKQYNKCSFTGVQLEKFMSVF